MALTFAQHWEFLAAITDPNQWQEWASECDDFIGLAMVGRSNVGKSSLINALFGKSVARTSKTPGRTQAINIFRCYIRDTEAKTERPFYLFDLPGYGHAEVSKAMKKNWNSLMEGFFTRIPFSVKLVNIQDARHPFQKSDLDFKDFFEVFKISPILVFNKYDKLKKQKDRHQFKKKLDIIIEKEKLYKYIYNISAETKYNIPLLEDVIIQELTKSYESVDFIS